MTERASPALARLGHPAFGLSATLGKCRRRSPCTGVGIPTRTLCQESAAVGPVKSWWFLQHSWRPLVVLDMSTWHLFPRVGSPTLALSDDGGARPPLRAKA